MSERCQDCGRKEQDPPDIRSGIMRDQCQTCGRLYFPVGRDRARIEELEAEVNDAWGAHTDEEAKRWALQVRIDVALELLQHEDDYHSLGLYDRVKAIRAALKGDS